MKILLISKTVIICFILTSCATTSFFSQSSESKKAEIIKNGDDNPVVLRSGTKKPIVKSFSRKDWIDIRKKTKNHHIKLYSTLGAGEWEVAINDARKFLQIRPNDPIGLYVLTIALAMNKDFQLANFYAKLLEKNHPNFSELKNIQALAILHKNNASMEDYRQVSQILTDNFEADSNEIAAGLNLGYLYLEMGSSDLAASIFSETRSRCGDCFASLMGHGIALQRLKEYDSAKKVFLNILEKDPNNIGAMYRLALLHKNGYNDSDKAKSILADVLATDVAQNQEIKRKANFLLRSMEASRPDYREMITDSSENDEPELLNTTDQE